MYYEEVFRELNKHRVKYAIAGGLAVVLHGFNRFTADADLIVALDAENLAKFYEILYRLGYRSKAPVTKEDFCNPEKRRDWIKHKNMVVFSFFHLKDPLKIIDMFVIEPIPFAEIRKHIIKIRIGALTFPTISIEHLKRLKLAAARQKDLEDIANLDEIKRLKNERK